MLLDNPDFHALDSNSTKKIIDFTEQQFNKKESKESENNKFAPAENIPKPEVLNEPEMLFGSWQKLEGFETSIEFQAFFDEIINKGGITLYKWQIEIGEELSKAKCSKLHPYKFCLCASNGSGKDAFVIAPFSLWFITTKIRSRVIITSSSGVQLTTQTEAYIKGLAEKVNNWSIINLGQPILKVNKRHITCSLSGSEIILFATDEEGKAEGMHPLEPNSEMAIIVNEAKSVSPEIFRALRRCTGYNYLIYVSTPGEPLGDFYKAYETWPHRKRVTFFDCPDHQSREEFDADLKELGEFSPYFRSKWLALFTFTGGKYVLSHERLEKLRAKIKLQLIKNFGSEVRIGLDIALSTNGDETCLSFFIGNKQSKQVTCRIKDATLLADFIEKTLNDNKISKQHEYIFADDGGVGRAVIDILRRKGWTINRVLNQSAARNKKQFRNRGAEIWSKFARLVEEGVIILLDDEKLYSQLASRKYKESTAGIDKLCLQSKLEMIAEGINSPDRADAAVLAFSNVKISEFLDKAIEDVAKENRKDSITMTAEEIEELRVWQGRDIEKRSKSKMKARYSLNVIMNR